eukprot:4473302-Amphidinium_carterae.1
MQGMPSWTSTTLSSIDDSKTSETKSQESWSFSRSSTDQAPALTTTKGAVAPKSKAKAKAKHN